LESIPLPSVVTLFFQKKSSALNSNFLVLMTFPNLRFGLGFENGLFSFLQLYIVPDFDEFYLSLFISCIRSLSKVLV